MADNEKSLWSYSSSPVAAFGAAATLLVATLILSFFLGRADVAGVLLAAILATVTAVLAAIVALAITKTVLMPAVQSAIQALQGDLDRTSSELAAVTKSSVDRTDVLIQLASSSNGSPLGVLTESQYAALEASTNVKQVVIALEQIGNEFQDNLADRPALVDYEAVVLENLRRGVKYFYITERSSLNIARAQRMARRAGSLSNQIRAALAEPATWKELPFSLQTVFLVSETGELRAFILLPDGADRLDRSWVCMSADHRDRWWGIAQDILETASPLPISRIADSAKTERG